MRNRSIRLLMISTFGLALTVVTGVARADEPAVTPEGGAPAGAPPEAAGGAPVATTPPPAAAAGVGADYNFRPLTLTKGAMVLQAGLEVSLSSGSVAKPFFITPNFYYGVSDQLTVGLAHNPFFDTWQFLGGGLCLSGTTGGCPKVYNNLALDSLFSLLQGATQVAFHGGLDFNQLSPNLFLALRLGVQAKFVGGPIGVLIDPAVDIGLTSRSSGNKESLAIPVRVGFQATPELNLALLTGISGPFSSFGDFYFIPVGVGGLFALNPKLDLTAQIVFDNLAGKGHSADFRTLALGANIRF